MRTFEDYDGNQWELTVTCASLRRVQAATGVNLGDLRNIQEIADRLRGDDLFVGEVALAVAGAEQLKAADVDRDEFLGAMRGDAIGRAADAVQEELIDFFRNPLSREAARKTLTLSRDLQRAVLGAIVSGSTSGASATSSPGSSASTPAPSPSGSSSG